ncbi:MAG TPA: hypothetical protein VF476_15230 [Chitinophagaceae bacterium]
MKTIYPKLFLPALLLALGSAAFAQNNYNQALSKYSYPIFTISGDQQRTGTAFFYQSGDTSFLVSNYHAIKGMNPLNRSIAFITDNLYLKYNVKGTRDTKLMTIDIGEETAGATDLFSIVDRIDLLKVPVELPDDADIHFINELVDEEYFDKEPEAIVAFGFPVKPGSVPAFYSRQQRLEGNINSNGFIEYDESLRLNFPSASDSARAILNATARYYYFIKPYAAQGYSGAPVFGKFRNENDEVIWRFTGVIFAGQPATQQTWAIKGSVALQYLLGEL